LSQNTMIFSLFWTAAPDLPAPALMHGVLPLSWALVLGALVAWVAGRLPARVRWCLTGVVLLWTLLPGHVSPAYWLGLAFQNPSVMSVVMAGLWLWQQARHADQPASLPVPKTVVMVGILLGWVLLADLLAWWPVSVYAWGFSPVALASMSALALVWWVVGGGQPGAPLAGLALAVVWVVFVLTRLPSGNVWDALLDPWLWMGLNGLGLYWAWCGISRRLISRKPSRVA